MKYTSAPWRIDPPSRAGCSATIVATGTGVIADVSAGDGEANARLIAAAPELLKACKSLMACIENGTLVRDITADDSSDWPQRMIEFVASYRQSGGPK